MNNAQKNFEFFPGLRLAMVKNYLKVLKYKMASVGCKT